MVRLNRVRWSQEFEALFTRSAAVHSIESNHHLNSNCDRTLGLLLSHVFFFLGRAPPRLPAGLTHANTSRTIYTSNARILIPE